MKPSLDRIHHMNNNFITSEIGIDVKKEFKGFNTGKHSNNEQMNFRNVGIAYGLKNEYTTVSTA